jgi:Holliday junction DNA helicase RuvA
MIAYLKGKVFLKINKSVILLVNDIGYQVFLSQFDLDKLELSQEAEFFIFSAIKEDAFDLYGFCDIEAWDLFKNLISVSGVGPKSAINILGLAKIEELKQAIVSGDPSILQQVSGIGKKTAERLVVELKEKISSDTNILLKLDNQDEQLVLALVSLGYKEREVKDMLKGLELTGDLSDKIRQVLQTAKK